MRRTVYRSTTYLPEDVAASGASGAGYQLGNAVLLGAGVAALSVNEPSLAPWLLAGLRASGAVLIATTSADLLLDYGGALVARIMAEINLRYNARLQPSVPAPQVRLVPVTKWRNAPSVGSAPTTQPAQPAQPHNSDLPTQTIDARADDFINLDDLLDFVRRGALIGFTRRAWLPERGERYQLPSGERISRKPYMKFVEVLKRVGILREDAHGAAVLAVELHEAIAMLGAGQLGGQLGGRANEADGERAAHIDTAAAGEASGDES